jgi:hypothetical protein
MKLSCKILENNGELQEKVGACDYNSLKKI